MTFDNTNDLCLVSNCGLFEAYVDRCIKFSQKNFFQENLLRESLPSSHFYFANFS